MPRWRRLRGFTVQDRVERTLLGQGLLSGVIVVIVVSALYAEMPDSAIKSHLRPLVRPVAGVAGLDQYWGVFAPNPPRITDTIVVEVTTTGGQLRRWTVPDGDPVLGHYSSYHWQKLKENVVRDPGLRPGLAHWAASQVAGSDVVRRVRIVRTVVTLPPPGSNVAATTRSSVLYDETIAGAR